MTQRCRVPQSKTHTFFNPQSKTHTFNPPAPPRRSNVCVLDSERGRRKCVSRIEGCGSGAVGLTMLALRVPRWLDRVDALRRRCADQARQKRADGIRKRLEMSVDCVATGRRSSQSCWHRGVARGADRLPRIHFLPRRAASRSSDSTEPRAVRPFWPKLATSSGQLARSISNLCSIGARSSGIFPRLPFTA